MLMSDNALKPASRYRIYRVRSAAGSYMSDHTEGYALLCSQELLVTVYLTARLLLNYYYIPLQKSPCQHSWTPSSCPSPFALGYSNSQLFTNLFGMPQANARQENKEAQKAIDKEQKRNRGVMSCAECRRSVFTVYRVG
jgi:hypothetical protein